VESSPNLEFGTFGDKYELIGLQGQKVKGQGHDRRRIHRQFPVKFCLISILPILCFLF